MTQRLVVLYTTLLLTFSIAVKAKEIPFEQGYDITHLDAIPQNEIFDIHQDRRGFMWVATLDGLVRYDGYKSKTYRMVVGENSLMSNMIIRIDEDDQGNIWLATFGKGLCKLDIKSDQFIHFNKSNTPLIKENSFNFFLLDPPYIWTGQQNNLIRYELDSTMSHFISKTEIPASYWPSENPNAAIRAIHKDFNNTIWVGSTVATIKISKAYGALEDMKIDSYPYGAFTFLNYYPTMLIGGESVYFPTKDADGNTYLEYLAYNAGFITHRQDFTLWLGNVSGIEAYKWDEQGLVQLSDFSHYPPYQYIKNKKISALENDKHGNLWVGTRGGGIDIFSPKTDGIFHYAPNDQKGSIKSNIIKSIFEDSKDNLWIGTEDKGINYLSGAERYNYSAGFKTIDIKNYPTEYNRAYAFAEQHTANSTQQERLIWVGTSFPVFLMAFDPETLEEKPLPDLVNTIGFVFSLAIQNDSIIWAGTYDRGLWRLVTDRDGKLIKARQYRHNEEDSQTITSDIIRDLHIDRNNNLWISTDNGLSKVLAKDIHNENLRFYNFTQSNHAKNLSYDYLLQIFESSTGQLWIGSMGGGLIGIDKELSEDSIRFFAVTKDDGLADNTIKGIIEDKDGKLWLSSNKGICKYNPETNSVVRYDEEDGLQDNSFSEVAFCKRNNGDILFGGYKGFNVIRPELLNTDSILPQLYFTDFTVINQLSEKTSWDKINQSENTSIEFSESIVLKYNENSFAIGFSGLHFNSAHKNKYKYQLEGFDIQWNKVNAQNSIAKYTNIPRGTYQFKVLGANCDNLWTTAPIILNIKVKPHPLTSILAWIVYGLLFLLAIWGTYRIMHLFHLRKNEIMIAEIEKQKTEELSQSKLRFFTNISHEFRTPLTLISMPLEKILKREQELSVQTGKELNIIRQNTNILLRLVNQILDFRKLEQNKMQLQAHNEDAIPFVKHLVLAFEPMLQEKNIHFVFSHQNEVLHFDFDADKLGKILNNLLSNAIKFTPENGSITLNVASDNDKVRLSVSDTGIGVAAEEQELVFVRYHQQTLQQSDKQSGTGIGLSLTKAMVDLHRGKITLKSSLGKGSTFTVVLPRKQHTLSPATIISKQNEATETELHEHKQDDTQLTSDEKMKYSLLIVEDNKDLRDMVANVFDQHYQVYTAPDGQRGYDKCMKYKPDLIISDVMMPCMSGLELLQKVKSEIEISHIPVILLTAKSTVEDQIQGHLAGADAYLPKPFNLEVLQAKVLAVFRNRERVKTRYKKEIEVHPLTIANSPGDVNFMERLLKVIEKNITDPEFNVDRMAEAYGTSRVNLNRKLKALTGETPIQFLRNIRLNHAAALLKTSNITISNVAWEVGFNDLATFRKHFKERYGVSPSVYIKTCKTESKANDTSTDVDRS